MKKSILLLALIGVTLACQVIPKPPPLNSTPRPSPTASRPAPLETALEVTQAPAATTAPGAPGRLAPFPVSTAGSFAPVQEVEWPPAGAGLPVAARGLELPVALDRIANPEVIAGLSLRQRAALLQNGFVIVRTREAQFAAIRSRVSERYGQPYYLTADAAVNALDLAVDDLRLALEREELHRRMIAVARAAFDQTINYLPYVQGGEMEAEVTQAAVFLGTGLLLLDPKAELPKAIADRAHRQAALALAAHGLEDAVLIPGYHDNFALYRPKPPYLGDAALEAYFRGRTWFGRAAFRLDGPDASRAPLVLTLALRQAQLPAGLVSVSQVGQLAAVDEWSRIYEALTFLDGPAPSYGPQQTAALMDRVYGAGVTIVGLGDPGKWEQFRQLAAALPPAELGGVPLNPLLAAQTTQDWRWIPHGLRLDNAIGAFLAPHRPSHSDASLSAPAALEWPAVLGSLPALEVLKTSAGATAPDYAGAVGRAQAVVSNLNTVAWGASTESQALYALAAVAWAKDDAYPPALRLPTWQTRDLASALGAWVALRRQGESDVLDRGGEASGPLSAPPPAVVEPNPALFYRLSYLAASMAEGLEQRGLTGVFATTPKPGGLHSQAQAMLDLADRLQRLGDIAARELQGEALTDSDRRLIVAPLGPVEQRAPDGAGLPTIPALVRIPGAGQYAASGLLDRIYTLAPIDDAVYVAQGGIYSFYGFPEGQYGQIDEPGWQRLVGMGLPESPAWIAPLIWPEGAAVDVLAFHAGDVFQITDAAGRLNLRAAPGRSSASLRRLSPGDKITLLEETAQANGQTWRQVRLDDGMTGWLLQEPKYYVRL